LKKKKKKFEETGNSIKACHDGALLLYDTAILRISVFAKKKNVMLPFWIPHPAAASGVLN